MRVANDAQLTLNRVPSDQRYARALSGLYWQIAHEGRLIQKSRSLWDEELVVPDDILPVDGYHTHWISGPQEQLLLAVERAIVVKRADKTFEYRVTVALDAKELALARRAFRFDLALGLGVLGLTLLTAFWLALSIGLEPLDRLRQALAALRAGRTSRLAGMYPSEVRPLVSDLNELLGQQETMIDRAKARAGDLAHGLKTPLTAISVMAEELTDEHEHKLSRELLAHVATMRRHLEHELALARSAHAQTAASAISLRGFTDRLVRTMQRLPRGDQLQWRVDIDDAVQLRIDDMALGEIVGNLLDNARKWAKASVAISAVSDDDWIRLEVADDGPGVPQTELESIVLRGRRLDSNRSGSGLGLSIASEIAAQLGGRLELIGSDLGGLGVHVYVPRRCSGTAG